MISSLGVMLAGVILSLGVMSSGLMPSLDGVLDKTSLTFELGLTLCVRELIRNYVDLRGEPQFVSTVSRVVKLVTL